jgi:hypothetical protein
MQIRERRTTWAFIRTTYDKTKKRGVSRCLGTLPKTSERLPEELAGAMTEKELAQVEIILRRVRAERDAERQERYARELPVFIDYAAQWYANPTRKPQADLAEDTRQAFSKLLAAMVKAGVGRTRRRKKAGSVQAPRKRDNV